MVRSARKRLPPGFKVIPLASRLPYLRHNVIFEDHTGTSALMSWTSSAKQSNLPHLSSWVFYMVHPDVPRDFDGCVFQDGLENDRIIPIGGPSRYEFFFLPGATAEECVTHYRGELEARGTIWRQIRKSEIAMKKKNRYDGGAGADDLIKGGSNGPIEESASGGEAQDGDAGDQLPGLVWPDHDDDCYFINYRGWLFMYTDSNIQWSPEYEDRQVTVVKFDPIPIEWEEGEVVRWDPMEHPIHSEQMNARGRKGYEEGLVSWMGNRKSTHWDEEAGGATCRAVELGWKSW
ncbi:hypothetical protein EDB81DRAFT_794736 [Dactylonectria macrodidyma]|uniref:Uncharacterized protein n=1 Tax=Dactylonectria macrodidyma TaxID=307937 RepID=A0A9P9EVX0_9HYPO|nr:hypothetical protein EDB81DRAFT_794736 [Dactylonectria macrodidyma]